MTSITVARSKKTRYTIWCAEFFLVMRFCFEPATDGFPGQHTRPPPVADAGRVCWRSGRYYSALQAENNFGHRKRASKRKEFVRTGGGLGCRLGRCFCALHRGVHRTPAPCPRNQTKIRSRKRADFRLYYSLFIFHHSLFINRERIFE